MSPGRSSQLPVERGNNQRAHPADPCQGITRYSQILRFQSRIIWDTDCAISSESPLSGAQQAPPSPGWLWMSKNWESSKWPTNSISSHQTQGASSCQCGSLSTPSPCSKEFPAGALWSPECQEPLPRRQNSDFPFTGRVRGVHSGIVCEGWEGSGHPSPSSGSWSQPGSIRDRQGGGTDAGGDQGHGKG